MGIIRELVQPLISCSTQEILHTVPRKHFKLALVSASPEGMSAGELALPPVCQALV